MSLQLTVARAVLVGMVQDSLPFRRTDKGGNAKRERENPAFWETLLGIGLLIAAGALFLLNTTHVVEMTVFASTLLVQSVPFLAAAAMVGIERYRRPDALDETGHRHRLLGAGGANDGPFFSKPNAREVVAASPTPS